MYLRKLTEVQVDGILYELPWIRWTQLWRDLGAEGDPYLPFADLVRQYAEPHRHYHTLNHIQHCLSEFNSALASGFIGPAWIRCAIWFHDAVYILGNSDNEHSSAEFARRVLTSAKVHHQDIHLITGLIIDTKHSRRSSGPYGDMVRDLDLSILGQAEEVFDEYERQIVQEWVPHIVSPEFFCSKRAEILKGFLAKKRIFSTRPFIWNYEERAQLNLKRSIARLQEGILPT